MAKHKTAVEDEIDAAPPAELTETEKLAQEIERTPLKTMRCYSLAHSLKITIRNDKARVIRDEHGKSVEKMIVDQGYTMHFHQHRCDVPMVPQEAEEGVREHQSVSELELALRKREKFFKYEWKTAEELARTIDRSDDTFVGEMYRLASACGQVEADRGRKNFMSEAQFEKLIRLELIEMGYLKRNTPAVATV